MKTIHFLAAVLLMLSLASCEHKDLCLIHPHSATVNVVFDWKMAPGADPSRMQLWFFPADGLGQPQRYQLSGSKGGKITIEPGVYHVICLDGDHENITYGNAHSFDAFELSTTVSSLLNPLGRNDDNRAPRADGTDVQNVVSSPDAVFGHALSDVSIPSGRSVTITMFPEDYTCSYEVVVHNAENLDNAVSVSATLSGLAPSVMAVSRSTSGDPSIIPFALTRSDATTLTGRFLTFGHCPVPAEPHKVVVYAIMRDGAQRYQIYDDRHSVTEQIHTSPDRRHVRIDLYGLSLPGLASGGMMPSVSDWESQTVDIDM